MPLKSDLERVRSSEEPERHTAPSEAAAAPGKMTRSQQAPLSGSPEASGLPQRAAAVTATQRLAPWVMDEGMRRAAGMLPSQEDAPEVAAGEASAPRIPATKIAAAGIRKLAATVDQLRTLDDGALLQRRKESREQISAPQLTATQREQATREHDAVELVCWERGLCAPGDSRETTLTLLHEPPAPRLPERRPQMREYFERKIGEHGSYTEARRRIVLQLDSPMTHASPGARQLGREQLALLDEEVATFRKAFSLQAMQTARAMLDDGSRAIAAALATYGLPVDTVRLTAAAERMQEGDGSGAATDWLALAHSDEHEARMQSKAPQRQALAAAVDRLQQQQQTIAQLAHEQDRLLALRARGEHASHHGGAERRPKDLRGVNGMDEARRAAARSQGQIARLPPLLAASPVALPGHGRSVEERLAAVGPQLRQARLELTRSWIEAERKHPILAAYRKGGEAEPAAAKGLGRAHSGGGDEQMRAVLQQVMPKLANILRAKSALASGELSPMTLPPVIELARAQMLVPPGSARAAAIADLVEDASSGGWRQWAIAAITLATTAISLVPTAGASVILATNLGALALDVYVAVESYEEYGLQQALVDTDLDQARSLSAEEPSLTGLAVQLVSLGLGPAAVTKLFRQAVNVRRLAMSGRGADDAIRTLDRLGEPHGLPHLGEEVAAEARAGRSSGQRAAKVRADAEGLALEGFAQSPRMTWRPNPDGAVRTTEEAVELARRWGVEIDDEIAFTAWDPASLPKNTHAEYFCQTLTGGVRIPWKKFLNARAELPVKISRDILSSDEAIVAVIAHEMHEINGLMRLFESRETIPAEEIYRLIKPGIKGNLHDQAWDVADEVVTRMRAASTTSEAP